MKFYLLMKSKLLIRTVGFLLSLAENEIFSAYEYEHLLAFSFLSAEKIACLAELSTKKDL